MGRGLGGWEAGAGAGAGVKEKQALYKTKALSEEECNQIFNSIQHKQTYLLRL